MLPISLIVKSTKRSHLEMARTFTGNCLHIPVADISDTVAVAYVVRHFGEGRVAGEEGGWEAFIKDIPSDR